MNDKNSKKKQNVNCLEGMKCPECGSLEPFLIVCEIVTRMFDDGSEEDRDHEWSDDSACECERCGFRSEVREFKNEEESAIMTEKKLSHAEQNARSWLGTIVEAYRIHGKIEDGECDRDTPIEFEGIPIDCDDDLARWAHESALEVQVRSDWHDPQSGPSETSEFKVLLTTGGPALRIVGEFDQHLEPSDPVLEHQDWGTPWIPVQTTNEEDEALEWFCRQFYWGE